MGAPGEKGSIRCKGVPAPPPPSKGGKGYSSSGEPKLPLKAVAPLGLQDALAGHTFRNRGVETKVTSRADVEASMAGWVPSRVRNANEIWNKTYEKFRASTGGSDSDQDQDQDTSRLKFMDRNDNQSEPNPCVQQDPLKMHPVEVVEITAENESPSCPAPWSLGAGVSRSYKEALLRRFKSEKQYDLQSFWPPLPPGHDADEVWKTLEPTQRFETPSNVQVVNAETELAGQPTDYVRFVCISDTHGRHRQLTDKLPSGDVLLHTGDFTMRGESRTVEDFAVWLKELPYERKVVIAGNHDLSFWNSDEDAEQVGEAKGVSLLKALGGDSVVYLQDSETSFKGLRIYGSPWQPEFGDGWVFGLPRGPALAQKWSQIPTGIDILMTHGPPLGRGDKCQSGARAGCADLLSAIQRRIKPVACVYGHIHEGAGISSDGITQYLNASSCNFFCRCCHDPIVVDLPIH